MAIVTTNIPALTNAITQIDKNYAGLLDQVKKMDDTIKTMEESGALKSTSAQSAAQEFQKTCDEMLKEMNASRERYNQNLQEKIEFWKITTASSDTQLQSEIKSSLSD